MHTKHRFLAVALLAVFASAAFNVQAQSTESGRFLSLAPPEGLPIIPVLEGWIANADGTTSFSFGIINRNEHALDIPVGEANYIEPAKYDGQQATHFPPGRTTGAFAITVPASEQDNDVWWYVQTGNSEVLKVPGRRGASAYELDFIRPRPQGALQPLVGVGESGTQAAGLSAMTVDYPRNPAQVGVPVELIINATDPAVRDTSDPRFGEPLDMGVTFYKFQGPGNVEFTRHPDFETETENPFDEDDPRARFFRPPGANELDIGGPSGVGRVYVTFDTPGEYVISAKVDIHSAPDSSNGDQCCWTNVYQRVTVE